MKKVVITASIEIGIEEVTIDGWVHYHVDKYYGADTDGNRGEVRTIISEVTDIKAYTESFGDVALTSEDQDRAAEILTRKFIEEA